MVLCQADAVSHADLGTIYLYTCVHESIHGLRCCMHAANIGFGPNHTAKSHKYTRLKHAGLATYILLYILPLSC